jgi:hypothetical protein
VPEAAITQAALPAGVIVFTPSALRAAKRSTRNVTQASGTDTEIIRNREGGDLRVDIRPYGDNDILRVKSAKFEIEKKSIGGVKPLKRDRYLITMTVHSGTTLSDVAIEFTPSGMTFSPAAQLEVQLSGTHSIEGKEIVGYHIDADGTVTEIRTKVEDRRGTLKLTIDVPGFSEYDWDDDGYDWEHEADDDSTEDWM